MKVTLLLADAAQAADGKLYILGGGWSMTGPSPTPSAIAIKIDVPWAQANIRHSFRIVLLDGDGHAVQVPTAEGPQGVSIEGQFEVGRPPGLTRGTTIDAALALSVPPLPLPPGQRFEWRFTINDEVHEDWSLMFSTRQADPFGLPQG